MAERVWERFSDGQDKQTLVAKRSARRIRRTVRLYC